MEWTGAGVLPITQRNNGSDYLLLSRDPQSKRWGDFGGMRFGHENPLNTAARKASEESNSALGSRSTLQQRLSRLIQETACVGPYRFFLCRFKAEELKHVVHTAKLKGCSLAWISAHKLFQAIALHGFESPSHIHVQGRTIRRRLEQCIRTSTCYQAFLDKNPDLKAQAEVAVGKGCQIHQIYHRILPGSTSRKLFPVIVCREKNGRPGRCYAIRSMQGKPSEWIIQDYTQEFRPTFSSSLLEQITLLFRRYFKLGRLQPSLVNRWALIRAVQQRSITQRIFYLSVQMTLQLRLIRTREWQKL